MSINNLNTYLNIKDSHLRVVSGNVYAQAMNIGGINVETAHGLQSVSDTGNVTSNTLQFSNATTGFVTTANAQIGRDLIVSGNATVSTDLTVSANATVADTLTISEHLIASKEATVTGNLHVTTIRSDSNVVAEYTGPHDRPLRKYPEIILPRSAVGAEYNEYRIDRSSEHVSGAYDGVHDLFNETAVDYADTWGAGWQGSTGAYSTSTGVHTTFVTGGSTQGTGANLSSSSSVPNGEWVSLKSPNAIKLDNIQIRSRNASDWLAQFPTDFQIWGSNDGTTWSHIKTFTGQSASGQSILHTYHINSTIFYNRHALVVTKIPGTASTIVVSTGQAHFSISELRFYGHEEGSGSLDTTLKTVYNVPATTGTQLEVYYDGRETSSYPESGVTVTDLAGTQQNGTLNGGVGFDTTYKAFTFDGSSSQNITSSALGFTGDQPHTFSFWIKDNTMNHPSTYVMHIGRTTHAASQNSSIEFRADRMRWASYANDVDYPLTGITSNTWYHITGSYVGGGATPKNKSLYVNGKKFDDIGHNNQFSGWETTAGDPINFQSGAFVTLGSSTADPGSTHFTGSIANFRLYSKALNADQVRELYDYQKDYFLGSKSQVTLYKGHLGVGVTEPSGQLELAGDERIQEYPPRGLTGYETLVEGHGVFCAYASSEVATGSYHSYQVFNKIQAAPWSDSTWNTHNPSYSTSTGLPTRGAELGGHDGEWLKLQLPYRIKVNSYQIQIYGPYYDYAPDSWVIIGSNDNNNWETIDSISGSGFTNSGTVVTKNYTVNNTNYYKYLALVCTKLDPQYSRAELNFSELRFFGTPGPTTLDKGSLTLGRSLDVPRVSRYDVDTETPRPEKLVVDFDTTVNSSPTDISGKGNHGTFNGTAQYSPSDKAFVFDGNSDYITVENTGASGNWAHSFSFWFKPTSDNLNGLNLYGLGNITGGGHASILYIYTGTNATGTSRTLLVSLYGDGQEIRANQLTIQTNRWYHMAVTNAGGVPTSANCKMYVDGVQYSTFDVDSGSNGFTDSLNLAAGTLDIGRQRNYNGGYFPGQISNFKLYNVALEPSEVKKLYRLGRTGRSMVISDTAVGIGKVPEAQLDVRGNLKLDGVVMPKIIAGHWTMTGANPSVVQIMVNESNCVTSIANGSGAGEGQNMSGNRGRFTAPVTGLYHFSTSCTMATRATSGYLGTMTQSGGAIQFSWPFTYAEVFDFRSSSNEEQSYSFSKICKMDAGDHITLQTYGPGYTDSAVVIHGSIHLIYAISDAVW